MSIHSRRCRANAASLKGVWFVHNLRLERPVGKRLAIQSGNQAVSINSYTVLYCAEPAGADGACLYG